MGIRSAVKQRLRAVMNNGRPELKVGYMLLRPRQDRSRKNVTYEYSSAWSDLREHLDRARTLDEWLFTRGWDGVPQYCNVDGVLRHQVLDSGAYNRAALAQALEASFPDARSVTEYGSGPGRNLLYLKRRFPELACYGYELCQPGVDLGRAAAKKFGLDVSYSRLDYVDGVEADYVFPTTDCAFTMHSLEQLPEANDIGLRNIHAHVRLGSIHIEPVVENFPLSYRGLLGRIYHYKINYLRNFERNARRLPLTIETKRVLNTAANPLVYPSLYVLRRASDVSSTTAR